MKFYKPIKMLKDIEDKLEFNHNEYYDLYKIDVNEFCKRFNSNSLCGVFQYLFNNKPDFLYRSNILFTDLYYVLYCEYINTNFNFFLEMKSIKDFITFYIYLSNYFNIPKKIGLNLQEYVNGTEILIFEFYEGEL